MPDSSDGQSPAPGAFQPYTPPPLAPQPIAPPPGKQGSSALKIILIILGIIVVLGVIGVGVVSYGVYRVAKAVHTDTHGHFTMNTPLGAVHTVSSATFTEDDLGIAAYPGAEPSKNGVRLNVSGKTVITGIFLTADSMDKVVAFYKDKAGPSARLITTPQGVDLDRPEGTDTSVDIKIRQSAGIEGGRTRIIIQHVFKNGASN
ncbi:MAG: hypothetical protein ACRD25_11365 [Terracidiphilus sp.]